MSRIVKRRLGRENASPYAIGSTHVIKIGFDARKADAGRAFPGKLPGFLIHHDTQDPASPGLLVDWEIMDKLGVSPADVDKAKQLQLKAPRGILPTELHFVILHDAARVPGGAWDYPGTTSEIYECWGKMGLFCSGNGVRADRRQNDGTKANIECVPFGANGRKAEEFCEFSADKRCKCHSRLVLCLYQPGPDGRPVFLSRLGSAATFRLDTGSEPNSQRFLAELDRAAEKLDGRIQGLTGVITYHVRRKRTGIEAAPVGEVSQIELHLDELAVRQREQQLHQRYIEAHGLDRKQIAAPEPEVTDAVEVAPAENEPDIEPEQAEDDPGEVEAEIMPDPEDDDPETISASAASVPELMDALARFVGAKAQEAQVETSVILGQLATYEFKGKSYPIPSIDWFSQGKNGSTKRTDILRATCERLEKDHQDFIITKGNAS